MEPLSAGDRHNGAVEGAVYPHHIEKSEPNRIKVKIWIRIRIKVKRKREGDSDLHQSFADPQPVQYLECCEKGSTNSIFFLTKFPVAGLDRTQAAPRACRRR
jgi:hypothetical protein